MSTDLEMNTVYHFQTDGWSEETIQALEDILCDYEIEFDNSWNRRLPLVKFSYYTSYHFNISMALQ